MRDTTIRDIEIALAVSTRQWSEHLHRFLVDHGGARVRLYVMQPEDAFSESFDVLFIDDICSFLSPHLVQKLNEAGRRVVGVYNPAEFPDGKDRLLACDVTEVIEADADPEEFLTLMEQLEINRETDRVGVGEAKGPVSDGVRINSVPVPWWRSALLRVDAAPRRWRLAWREDLRSDLKGWDCSIWISGPRLWPKDWAWVCIPIC